ncbi:hypothetical protein [Sphingobium sp. Sx8-8]|uniref:hypothetical protein n=1 Tax=Sphingobium sp. Sx8-8 TaxID=2933617 RepID=UPI001F5A3966|nr:hypothetical protein [Sphingobium sp. Sx8-8]
MSGRSRSCALSSLLHIRAEIAVARTQAVIPAKTAGAHGLQDRWKYRLRNSTAVQQAQELAARRYPI